MNALEVEGLCKQYPAFTLSNVSFAVPCGSIVGFLGRNGAGKSTMLKLIAGLVRADRGVIRIFGREQRHTDAETLGIVFGGTEFYSYKKIGTIANVYARFYRLWDEDTYRRFLAKFSLDENKRFRELSNGMKVKFLLALACSHRAKLLVLDEPTSGLDPVSRAEILAMLREFVQAEGRAVLFSTQIVSDLEKCADRVVYIRGGKIIRDAEYAEYANTPHFAGTSALEHYLLREEGVYDNADL